MKTNERASKYLAETALAKGSRAEPNDPGEALMPAQSSMRVYRGVYYFPSYETARAYAASVGAPTDRIIWYTRGWAIQWRISGPYVGPNDSRSAHIAGETEHLIKQSAQ